jgi:5-methylcytosine-specific restriction endonuclease McrA
VVEALVLNATYEPLCVVSLRRAVVLVLAEKAVMVEQGEGALHGPTIVLPIPAVVRLARYVKVPYKPEVPLTRKGVLARDGHRCVYCGATATSLDHVVPRSRACSRCNHAKADRSVADLGWRLHRPPRAPSGAAWRVLGARRPDPRWSAYLTGMRPVAVSA